MKVAILVGVLIVAVVVVFLVLRKPKPVDKSFATYSGAIGDYRGGKKLIVAFTASWASVWKLTALELRKLDVQKYDLCVLDASTDRDEIRQFGVTFFPTVVLIEDGKITRKAQNLTSIDQLKGW